MRENPEGMFFAKVKSGQVRIENYYDFMNRMTLMRIDEDMKAQKKDRKKASEERNESNGNNGADSQEGGAQVARAKLNNDKPRRWFW